MNMRKVGLLTLYKDNFGSILQCYATKKVLENAGLQCTVIYEMEPKKPLLLKKTIGFLRLIYGYLFDYSYIEKRKNIKNMPIPLSTETWSMMDKFVDEVLMPEGYTYDQLCLIESEYDKFIVGSDQVWNLYNNVPQSFFLKFSEPQKRIAFSVSLGASKIDSKQQKILKQGIEGFEIISVREKTAFSILEKISNAKIVKTSDPTVLLGKEDWKQFYQSVVAPQKKDYILVHFLNTPSDLAIARIKSLAFSMNLPVLCIGYRYDIFKELKWEFINCDPFEYVMYIDEAEYVCTDSFHTTLFSINLEKQFFVFERQYAHSHPQTSRITDLLEHYRLIDRFVREKDDVVDRERIVFDRSAIEFDRSITKNYLLDRVGICCE